MDARAGGFSLLELLISIAIIGVVSAIAVPAYQSYVETANMTKVNAAYEHAVRMTQQEFSKNTTRVTLGLTSTLPKKEEGWIDLFNEEDRVEAPGGGPAYIPKKGRGRMRRYGDPSETGAIIVDYNKKRRRVDIYRPAYLGLKPFRARIEEDSVKVKEL